MWGEHIINWSSCNNKVAKFVRDDILPLMTQHTSVVGTTRSRHSAIGDLMAHAAKLQSWLRTAIEAMPRRASSAGELSRLLGLDRSSVWRIWGAVYSESPADAGAALSGEAALKRFIEALVSHGTEPSAAAMFTARYTEFMQCALAGFGDLATARIALSRASPRAFLGDSRLAVQAFDAARFRQGMQVATSMRIAVRAQSQFENLVDSLHARHFEGLMTLGDADSHLLQRRQILAADSDREPPRSTVYTSVPVGGDAETPEQSEAIPPGARPTPLVARATNLNGRSVWQIDRDRSTIETRVSGGVCGLGGQSNICMAEVLQAQEAMFPHTPFVGLAAEHLVPAELLVIEFYIEEAEVRSGLIPTPRVYDVFHANGGFPGMPVDIGESCASVEHYTPGTKRPRVEEIRAYPTIVRELEGALERLFGEMHLFRWRVPYPMVDANYSLCAELDR